MAMMFSDAEFVFQFAKSLANIPGSQPLIVGPWSVLFCSLFVLL
jgi:hypothetical protein